MRRHDPRDHRPIRPALEGLEARALLSTAAATAAASAQLALVDSSNGSVETLTSGTFVPNPTILRQAADALYPADMPPGVPTPREVRRQTFTSRWVGEYTIGAPRFSDRASTIHLYGTVGSANQFSRGKFQIALFPPADPGAIPTPGNPYANQITGVADLFAQNYLQSGSSLMLDLNGQPAAGARPNALPTQLTWTYDSNTSAGPYAAPAGILPGSGFTQGAGTLELRWVPDPHPLAGTLGSGKVIVTFQGLINTSQIVSGVSKFIS